MFAIGPEIETARGTACSPATVVAAAFWSETLSQLTPDVMASCVSCRITPWASAAGRTACTAGERRDVGALLLLGFRAATRSPFFGAVAARTTEA